MYRPPPLPGFVGSIGSVGLLCLCLAVPAAAGRLVINSDQSFPGSRKAWQQAVAQFKTENPDIEVSFNLFAREAYKTSIRQWLTSAAPDVVFWYAGERMRYFVARQLLEDVSDLWNSDWQRDLASSRAAVTVGGKQYGVPYSYYHWGMYYRKDLFEKAGIKQPPQTLDELREAGKKLKAQGITPLVLGSKALWPLAGWFDYLNLRLNGYEFHQQLMAGKVAYTDARVRATFALWKQLIDDGLFLPDHAAYDWQEAQPFMYHGKAAMVLMGNFASTTFPAAQVEQIGFFPFPQIDPKIARAEEAPIDTVHIPARAKNKKDARRFLQFVARADVQEMLNRELLQIPTHAQAKVADNRFLQTGQAMLAKAAATSQFYDRDTNSDMAPFGLNAFAEFMAHPERLDAILQALEAKRAVIFK
jgi:multiple sugar transport system substrate-binding protein